MSADQIEQTQQNRQAPFQGSSAAAERLRMQVQRFAPHFRTVLLVGEAGTGKQDVARELHRLSPAASEPFSVMEIADFLNDAGSPKVIYLRGLCTCRAEMQEGLARRLATLGRETRLRETRLIVACEAEPRALLAAGRVHAEVLERVGMLEIRLSPLIERLEDLEALTAFMLAGLGCHTRWSPADFTLARNHPWPGNLVELREACESFATTGVLRLEGIAGSRGPVPATIEEVRLERVIARHVMDVLERCAGNKLKAAELLGISRSTLYRMLQASGSA